VNTGSAATRASAEASWAPVLADAGAYGEELGQQLLAVAHEIAKAPLRGPLTDPGRAPEDKAALAARLFTGKADDRVVVLLQDLVRGRWSRPVDLLTALHDLGIKAILAGAAAGGSLETVEQELFAVHRAIENDRALRLALEPSKRSRTEDRVTLARRAFAGSISSSAMSLVVWCVRHRADGGVPYNLRRVTRLAAGMQGRAIADVTTAVAMTSAQEDRLRAVLASRLGTDVELNTSVDPEVIGGVRVSVRDLVIDSTVRSSVDALRTSLAG